MLELTSVVASSCVVARFDAGSSMLTVPSLLPTAVLPGSAMVMRLGVAVRVAVGVGAVVDVGPGAAGELKEDGLGDGLADRAGDGLVDAFDGAARLGVWPDFAFAVVP